MKEFGLLSVSDKTGIVELAEALLAQGLTLLASGGTFTYLRQNDIAVVEVPDITGFPEILGGRVKTLHPKIFGGILADLDQKAHLKDLETQQIPIVKIVVCNLYPFSEVLKKPDTAHSELIENIDIGGPSLLRAAAKNYKHCLPVCDPKTYPQVIAQLKSNSPDIEFSKELAYRVFDHVASYDRVIADYLGNKTSTLVQSIKTLRYGENPQQQAFLAGVEGRAEGLANADILQGKELSYNNYLDLDAGYSLVQEFQQPACVIMKHTNPCGFASGTLETVQLFDKALASDPKSAFGGIVAFNRTVNEACALHLAELFLECVVAPEFSDDALALLKKKKNLRLLRLQASNVDDLHIRSIKGAFLLQTTDSGQAHFETVTKTAPTSSQLEDLTLAEKVCKHAKSNAIVLLKDSQVIGVGAGQMSRIDALELAVKKAKQAGFSTDQSVMASDAFFPFSDCVEYAAEHGIISIVQPGGSKRDQESIDAANASGISMVFSGFRHFKH